MGEFADGSGLLNLFDLAIPGLPAPVLMDHEAHAGSLRRFDDPAARLERGRERLLAHDVNSTRGSMAAHLLVGGGRSDDVDESRALPVDHLAPVRVAARDAMGVHEGTGFGFGDVADGCDLHFRYPGPGLALEPGEVSGADHGTGHAAAPNMRSALVQRMFRRSSSGTGSARILPISMSTLSGRSEPIISRLLGISESTSITWCGIRLDNSSVIFGEKDAATTASCTKLPPPQCAAMMGNPG